MSERVYSKDEEYFNCESIEEAVQNAADRLDSGVQLVGQIITIYEGKSVKKVFSDFAGCAAEGALETAGSNAYDECGEFAEDWLYEVTGTQLEDLDDRLSRVLDQWATDHEKHPTFYLVEDVVEISVKIINEDGDWEFV